MSINIPCLNIISRSHLSHSHVTKMLQVVKKVKEMAQWCNV